MSAFSFSALLACYVTFLFGVAWRADRPNALREPAQTSAVTQGLSLAVLCTAWTYYGAIGQMRGGSWLFLANLGGPIVAMALGWPLWIRIAQLVRQEKAGSIADFLATRYGRSRALGSIVAIVAVIGALPYSALQVVLLSRGLAFVSGGGIEPEVAAPAIFVLLALFAILFGARRPSLARHNRGLIAMVAVESVIKLVALAVLAGLAIAVAVRYQAPAAGMPVAAVPPISFLAAMLLSAMTVITLPRQFHLSFVTLGGVEQLRTMRRVFLAYMVAFAAAVVPIGIAARTVASAVDANVVILAVAQNFGPATLMIVCLGGFSAATAMMVVETTALSATISNELVLPLLARTRALPTLGDPGSVIVTVRRVSIILIHALAWWFYTTIDKFSDVAFLGFVSLAASAQLLPALVGAVAWRGGKALGAMGGIIGGMAVWLAMLVLPPFVPPLDRLFAAMPVSRLDATVTISLGVNVLLYVSLSQSARTRLIDDIQARLFVPGSAGGTIGQDGILGVTWGDLKRLVGSFVGTDETEEAFRRLARTHGLVPQDHLQVSVAIARAAERILAGVIGAPSARNVLAVYLASEDIGTDRIGRLLDEASHAAQFSRDLLQQTLNSIEQAVCVIDAEARLVAWNAVYVRLHGAAGNEISIGGPPIEALAPHHDATGAGWLLSLEQDVLARRRAIDQRRFGERSFRRIGSPLPNGNYVLSYTDVTEVQEAAAASRRMNEELERRVETRTHELVDTNAALAQARELAERASLAQRRFIAAASHDLLQPMHAARLFLGTALADLDESHPLREAVSGADQSVSAADRLLRALLNLSRLETGGSDPEIQSVDLGALFDTLRREFTPIAAARGLALSLVPTDRWVSSDPDLLRSVLQNLIGNALRYTNQGRVCVGCRSEGHNVRIEVRDTGRGIDPASLQSIFREYERLPEARATTDGAGLGLAIADRICNALGHHLNVRSPPGGGSIFSVSLAATEPRAVAPIFRPPDRPFEGVSVLCVEDDVDVLRATAALLQRWGARVTAVRSAEAALAEPGPWAITIADHHLGAGLTGMALMQQLGPDSGMRILVTADVSEAIVQQAQDDATVVLRKPVAPASLRALLVSAGQDLPN